MDDKCLVEMRTGGTHNKTNRWTKTYTGGFNRPKPVEMRVDAR